MIRLDLHYERRDPTLGRGHLVMVQRQYSAHDMTIKAWHDGSMPNAKTMFETLHQSTLPDGWLMKSLTRGMVGAPGFVWSLQQFERPAADPGWRWGDELPAPDARQALAKFVHRHGEGAWWDDADWLATTQFQVRRDGHLDLRIKFCHGYPTQKGDGLGTFWRLCGATA